MRTGYGSHDKYAPWTPSHRSSRDHPERGFYMLRPVNKTDHMQQGLNGLAFRLSLVRNCLSNCILGSSQRVTIKNSIVTHDFTQCTPGVQTSSSWSLCMTKWQVAPCKCPATDSCKSYTLAARLGKDVQLKSVCSSVFSGVPFASNTC